MDKARVGELGGSTKETRQDYRSRPVVIVVIVATKVCPAGFELLRGSCRCLGVDQLIDID